MMQRPVNVVAPGEYRATANYYRQTHHWQSRRR